MLNMTQKKLTIRLLKDSYAVCRLAKDDKPPVWINDSEFYSVTKTADELSVVCLQKGIPNDIKCEKDWRILKVEGPLDFSLIGILSSISTILAQQRISIFAVSTYDTDYILVKDADIDSAVKALADENYEIIK